jgi:hypothetical protein
MRVMRVGPLYFGEREEGIGVSTTPILRQVPITKGHHDKEAIGYCYTSWKLNLYGGSTLIRRGS